MQIVGRGTRLHKDKKNLLVIDFLWKAKKEVRNVCETICEEEFMAKYMKEFLNANTNRAYDLLDLYDVAEGVTKYADRDRAREKLIKAIHSRGKTMDPTAFLYLCGIHDHYRYEPVFYWEKLLPSYKQIEALNRLGIDTSKVKCLGYASILMNIMINRIKNNKASARQCLILSRYGIADKANEIEFNEASKIIDAIAQIGWRGLPSAYRSYSGTKMLNPLVKIREEDLAPVEL
jgi:hypothetical protein